jgi:hypothetical protein
MAIELRDYVKQEALSCLEVASENNQAVSQEQLECIVSDVTRFATEYIEDQLMNALY